MEAPAVPHLVGNEAVRARLAGLAARGRLHPCLLFEGIPGLGKAGTARWLAMLANCEAEPLAAGDPAAAAPCGACWSCRKIAAGDHPDVIEVGLDPERATPIISVAQARELIGRLRVRPFQARRRFVFIDPAEALTVEAANALLKTLEEPPADTGFVLVSAAGRLLLPTVLSRSQRVHFQPVETSRIEALLVERGTPPDTAAFAARLAAGSPGRALALAEGEAERWRETRDALLAALAGGSAELFAATERWARGERAEVRERVERVLDVLGHLLRDALAVGAGRESAVLDPAVLPALRAWAGALHREGARVLVEALAEARRDLDANVTPRLALDALLATFMTELGPARRAGGRTA